MPSFDWIDVTGIITPETLVAVVIAGVFLAAFLWTTVAHVQTYSIFRIFVSGLAFILVIAAGRWSDLSPHWEAWLGTAVLWCVYIGVAAGSVFTWRRIRAGRNSA